jgi:hypothetical protein
VHMRNARLPLGQELEHKNQERRKSSSGSLTGGFYGTQSFIRAFTI